MPFTNLFIPVRFIIHENPLVVFQKSQVKDGVQERPSPCFRVMGNSRNTFPDALALWTIALCKVFSTQSKAIAAGSGAIPIFSA